LIQKYPAAKTKYEGILKQLGLSAAS